jgi:predicted nucleotidyltransferase
MCETNIVEYKNLQDPKIFFVFHQDQIFVLMLHYYYLQDDMDLFDNNNYYLLFKINYKLL